MYLGYILFIFEKEGERERERERDNYSAVKKKNYFLPKVLASSHFCFSCPGKEEAQYTYTPLFA